MKNDIRYFVDFDICRNCDNFCISKTGNTFFCKKISEFKEIPDFIRKFNPEKDKIGDKEKKTEFFLDKRCALFDEQYISFINRIPPDEIEDYKQNSLFN